MGVASSNDPDAKKKGGSKRESTHDKKSSNVTLTNEKYDDKGKKSKDKSKVTSAQVSPRTGNAKKDTA